MREPNQYSAPSHLSIFGLSVDLVDLISLLQYLLAQY